MVIIFREFDTGASDLGFKKPIRARGILSFILWRDRMDVPSQCTIVRTIG
jgi:hypothetical protein